MKIQILFYKIKVNETNRYEKLKSHDYVFIVHNLNYGPYK